MHTQLQGIGSILKVVWIVNHQNKFLTRLHSSCIIFASFLDIRLEVCSFTKNEPLNKYFLSILIAILTDLTLRAAIFKKTSFSQNTFNGCFPVRHFPSCYMIQKIMRELVKLETAYLLHGRCNYSHIYSKLGTLKRSKIPLSIYL